MKKLRSMMLLPLGLSLFGFPSWADDANTVRYNQLLNQSTASFKQGNFMEAVGQVKQACELLREDPAASSDNYEDVAAACIQGIEQNIQRFHPGSNNFAAMASVSARVSAIQPLLRGCMEWQPSNPRWHYDVSGFQKARRFGFMQRCSHLRRGRTPFFLPATPVFCPLVA